MMRRFVSSSSVFPTITCLNADTEFTSRFYPRLCSLVFVVHKFQNCAKGVLYFISTHFIEKKISNESRFTHVFFLIDGELTASC